jgi:hypothetical protein
VISGQKESSMSIFFVTLCIRAALRKDIRMGMDRWDIQTYIYTDVHSIIVKAFKSSGRTMQITLMVHVCSGLGEQQSDHPACSRVGLGHCFNSKLKTDILLTWTRHDGATEETRPCLNGSILSRPVDVIPEPVPCRWARLQSEPCSSSGYQPNGLSQHCNRRPRAPAFATSIESQEIEIHPIVPATQASTSWTLQCGKNSGSWEHLLSSRVRRWMRCHRNTRAVP